MERTLEHLSTATRLMESAIHLCQFIDSRHKAAVLIEEALRLSRLVVAELTASAKAAADQPSEDKHASES